jgi:dihydrodipicolinate synthase/N-acetylneuraminate lyase
MILPTLLLGGRGAIVAVANVIPEDCVSLYKAFKENDLDAAGKYQNKASFVNKVLVRENPQIAAIKVALKKLGYNPGIPRKPLMPIQEYRIDELKSLLSF